MSKNIDQIFIANPITTNTSTDLMYFGQSPYGPTNDAAMTYANFSAQFGASFTTTQVQQNAFNSAPDGGILNQYDLVLSPVASSYTDNLTLLFSPANTNTSTTPTIQINSQVPKTIVKAGGALEAGDIVAGTNAILIYSASNGNFELINPQKGSSSVWANFTPTVTLVGGTGNTVPTFTTNSGRFIVNGKMVSVRVVLANDTAGTAGAGSGQVNVALPIAVGSNVVSGGAVTAWNFGVGWFDNNNSNTAAWLYGNLVASATTVALAYGNTAVTSVTTLTGDQMNAANTRYITLNFSYEIN